MITATAMRIILNEYRRKKVMLHFFFFFFEVICSESLPVNKIGLRKAFCGPNDSANIDRVIEMKLNRSCQATKGKMTREKQDQKLLTWYMRSISSLFTFKQFVEFSYRM